MNVIIPMAVAAIIVIGISRLRAFNKSEKGIDSNNAKKVYIFRRQLEFAGFKDATIFIAPLPMGNVILPVKDSFIIYHMRLGTFIEMPTGSFNGKQMQKLVNVAGKRNIVVVQPSNHSVEQVKVYK